MDELMSRFVLNIKRGENNDLFEEAKKTLTKKSLLNETEDKIIESVTESMQALGNLMDFPIVDQGREMNQENQMYLKLLEKATKSENLQIVKMLSLDKLKILKKPTIKSDD